MQDFDQFGLDGRALRIFLSIYRSNSISQTAHEFGVSQSTISHTLERLRVGLGDPLFVRKGRGITPTDGAVLFVPKVQALVSGFEALTQDRSYDPETDSSTVTIAGSLIELSAFLEKFAVRLRAAAPHLVIRLTELGSRAELGATLEAGQADLAAVVHMRNYGATLKSEPLYSDGYAVYFDAAHRAPVESVADYSAATHAVLETGGGWPNALRTALDERGIIRNIGLKSANSFSLARLMKGTDMLATLPVGLRRTAFARFAHVPTPFKVPKMAIDLVWHRRSDHTPRNRWMRTIAFKAGAGLT